MNARTLYHVVPVLVAALLLSVSTAPATTYVVRPDGSGDFPTIQAAIDSVLDGDIIELTDGTFTGDGNRDIDYLGKTITVRSRSGEPDLCIIDCEGSDVDPHRGFLFHSGEGPASLLEGVTVTHGHLSGEQVLEDGGGVHCYDSSPTIRYCTFAENSALQGGAVYCGARSSPSLDHCTFSGNSGQGLIGGGSGGGLCCDDSSPEVTDCTFLDNWAYRGGGVYCLHSSLALTRCEFSGNWASHFGGGVGCEASWPMLTGCTFSENTGYGFGGGIGCFSGSPSINGCTLLGNWASQGGALYVVAAYPPIESTIISFSVRGEAVFCEHGQPTLACCDVYGNAGGDWVGCIAEQYGINGNIAKDPLFCDASNGDFTLHADSPCAPENSPAGCSLIGAWPVDCGRVAVALDEASSPWVGLRVHPNPIRTSGVVEWTSDGGATTGLRLYDPKGRLVLARELADGASGRQQIQWGDLVGGGRLSPGIYFLELGGLLSQQRAARVIVIR